MTKSSPLEPAVAMSDYDESLRIMNSMALMLERSPHAFRQLHEEELRFFFLGYLNGQYDGGATGETFNFRGKTDILVTAKGRNVFIAECKFWSGPAGFTETINQLLGYLSWRDTKTAIFVFNRGTQMSTAVRQLATPLPPLPPPARTRCGTACAGYHHELASMDQRTPVIRAGAHWIPRETPLADSQGIEQLGDLGSGAASCGPIVGPW